MCTNKKVEPGKHCNCSHAAAWGNIPISNQKETILPITKAISNSTKKPQGTRTAVQWHGEILQNQTRKENIHLSANPTGAA